MAGEIADVPGRGRTAARQLGRDIDHGHEVELHAAERPGLVEAEEPGFVQRLLGLARQAAGLRRTCRAVAEDGH
jgi:hypothetical protein